MIVTAVFRPEAELTLFLRMRSVNVYKSCVTWCCISTTSFPLLQITVAEHVGESGFNMDNISDN